MASDLVRGKDGGPAPMASTMVRDVVGDKRLFLQYIRIALFRGLFRVTDMNPRNVLVNADGNLVSIDENNAGTCASPIPKKRPRGFGRGRGLRPPTTPAGRALGKGGRGVVGTGT